MKYTLSKETIHYINFCIQGNPLSVKYYNNEIPEKNNINSIIIDSLSHLTNTIKK